MIVKIATCLTAIALVGSAALPGRVAARPAHAKQYPYILIDLGTLGGPFARFDGPGIPLTPKGTVLGLADSTIPDTDYPNFNGAIVGFPDPNIAVKAAGPQGAGGGGRGRAGQPGGRRDHARVPG
jgi:hypothetical protein